MVELAGFRRVHLVGVGGAGMSALGKLLVQKGHTVSGSDLAGGEELARLGEMGANVWTGSDPAGLADADLVVASSAVPESDPELLAARKAGIICWRRPQLLEAITAETPAVAATGTHGKTTSTALLVAGLRALGRDPSFVVGGELMDLRTNAHLGEPGLLVLEADEAFRTFELLSYAGLMVTNVEPEHLDHFGSLGQLEDVFAAVVDGVDGPVVVGGDDPGGRRLAERTGRSTVGVATGSSWRISGVEEGPDSVRFNLRGGRRRLRVEVGRPGIHVARNAAGVLALLAELGYDPEQAATGFPHFQGVKRRFELRGRVGGVTIIDDYAHHPTEVAASLHAAARGGWSRIWAVFQPHLYSRTRLFHEAFGRALAAADRVVVTDVYGSRENPEPGVTGELVAEAARAAGAQVNYVPHRSDVAILLAGEVERDDLVLTMGAGDITLSAGELAILLAMREAS